ncbi:DUF2326 domain-containing protein [Bacillus timonensis]|uniref:DUF2326 domain-containing protein n=1 Tax=Bacillus timonensis TaxID=1033734 RepID=A0A4S3PW20_9BACI|nr:DUF2326 domain-containing protein [Bacillus timonensis]THE13182.1 DUF2326 domain-containing protein [Bacillus timonensis]
MILKRLLIYSYQSKEILKEYIFNQCGLNVILGEKKEDGKETNGVGKTTMVEAMNFLLGGSCPDDFIGKPTLTEKDIFLVLEVFSDNQNIYLGRLINQPEKGYYLNAAAFSYDLSDWIDKEDSDFKKYINNVLLGLTPDEPTFSALREYIIRDEKEGFTNIGLPNRNAMNEAMYLAFLFNLPYDFEKEIVKYKKQQKEFNQKLSIIKSLKSEISDLKLREKKLTKEIKELDDIIEQIKITKKFEKDAEEYQVYKSQYNELQNLLFELKHVKKQYQNNINDLEAKLEEIKRINDIQPFYEQLIGFFPDKVKKNQDDIFQFYNFMVDSRGRYFNHKINEIDYEIKQKQKKLEELSIKLQNYTQSFKNTDLITDITKVTNDKSLKYEELAQIRVKINMYQEKTDVTADINRVKQEILKQIDIKLDIFKTYENSVKEFKELFNSLVLEVYDENGILDIELNNNTGINDTTGRIKINCRIDDEKSHGRLHMKINMFDLTWFIDGLNKRDNITFLIHDGSFSKPDRFAKYRLIKYVDKLLKEISKGQYFITINVDELEEAAITELYENKSVIAKLMRTEDNKERFFGFRYTS